MREYFVNWLKDELDKGSLPFLRRRGRVSLELPTLLIEIVISPKNALKKMGVHSSKLLLVLPCHGFKGEHKAVFGRSKHHIIQSGRQLITIEQA